MTFEQYLSSKSEPMPFVELAEGEYTKGVTVEGITQVFINIWKEQMYVVKTGDNRLYVPDNFGYPSKPSCFHLK
jgi:hypothetical protein